jgi:hypothetical protein
MRMRGLGAWISIGLLLASAASALTQGQQDDFDGVTDAWAQGTPALGGPDGDDDGFLLLHADGVTQNGKLVTFNQLQWAGSYTAAGIEAIGMFVRNLGATDLKLRVALGNTSAPSSGGTWFASTDPVLLTAGGDWELVVFSLAPDDLTRTQGTGSYATVLGGVVTLRILHSAAPSAFGDNIVATLGVDQVLALPEPGAVALSASGVAALALCARMRARRVRRVDADATAVSALG